MWLLFVDGCMMIVKLWWLRLSRWVVSCVNVVWLLKLM